MWLLSNERNSASKNKKNIRAIQEMIPAITQSILLNSSDILLLKKLN
ncbi:hypothetical protein TMUPMC115_0740 [Tetragenococcus muriaticus PMC-11-5]|uniref:Uncharacterized protein n=2 Tax=Tetragenococcus muriaticus TaxID=64642 RepID=A0A091C5W6_9ENTE|nr:hypothetical protein TMU3MR103_0682 [Tetragenococcus muriaticus 3MR10-3]KFN92807.1 hypothetical protein TMUPMC115_0740 [Tetragenococcus muriaticus PMC-11-5]